MTNQANYDLKVALVNKNSTLDFEALDDITPFPKKIETESESEVGTASP